MAVILQAKVKELPHGDSLALSTDAVRSPEGSPERPDSAEDLLQLKPAQGLLEPPRDAEPGMTEPAPPAKKRKRTKIQPGKTTGSRIVFDEDGSQVGPLSALARADTAW